MPVRTRLQDVMVAVAIVGLAVTFVILPILKAREQGRTTQCLNNNRQLGLSLIQFENQKGFFPPSESGGDRTSFGQSAWVLLLPYLDADMRGLPTYDPGAKPWSLENSGRVELSLGSMLCPANPRRGSTPASQIRSPDGRTMPGHSRFAQCHYGINWGGDRLGVEGDFAATNGSCRGVTMPVPGENERGPNRTIGAKDITDGLAETVLVAERRGGQGWAVAGWAGSEFDAGGSPSYRGWDRVADMGLAGSFHDGGMVTIGFCDGRARLVSPALNRRLWYAMLTRDGAEAVPKGDEPGR